MKIRCKDCEKIFNDNNIIIDGIDYNTFFVPYCKECYKKFMKEKEE